MGIVVTATMTKDHVNVQFGDIMVNNPTNGTIMVIGIKKIGMVVAGSLKGEKCSEKKDHKKCLQD